MSKGITIGKPESGSINEDAVLAQENVMAVSDGAGGGGLFADRWSAYLLKNLPCHPLNSSEELDSWIGEIWEPFYNESEKMAEQLGGMALDKFYEEGSFATLVAIWRTSDSCCRWISYGDSVAFHYNYSSKKLESSIVSLSYFDRPPYLINCKDELNAKGFQMGEFSVDDNSLVFATSDALAHYILMMFKVCHKELYKKELEELADGLSKNTNYLHAALALTKLDFEKDVLEKLINCMKSPINLIRHTSKLQRNGLLAIDDYTIVKF